MKSFTFKAVLSAILFVAFFINVLLGAYDYNLLLSDVGEALVLFCAVLVFVNAILAAESQANN